MEGMAANVRVEERRREGAKDAERITRFEKSMVEMRGCGDI